MKRTERLGQATAPDGSVLSLFRHDRDFYIRVDGIELMSTRRHHSEDRLAELACEPLADRPHARVLVGGLGLGFTLRRSLDLLAGDATVVVAELVPEVVAWNREFGISGGALDDPRVELIDGDVSDVIADRASSFDAIMLDVDNGAEAFTTSSNAGLYRAIGVEAAVRALKPGGRLAYWSANQDAQFEDVLRDAGLGVELAQVRAHASSGPRHVIIVGVAPLSSRS
ncbi:MAG: hypothetical protein JWO05_752 [Gemmatimonadetes bacterium]|nr:hypothetical protein [Gemmatimonadota bacterium]